MARREAVASLTTVARTKDRQTPAMLTLDVQSVPMRPAKSRTPCQAVAAVAGEQVAGQLLCPGTEADFLWGVSARGGDEGLERGLPVAASVEGEGDVSPVTDTSVRRDDADKVNQTDIIDGCAEDRRRPARH